VVNKQQLKKLLYNIIKKTW